MELEAGRHAGMLTTTGAQGVGKTYLNMYIIKDYVRDKFANKVAGRKCLIFDTNGEYTKANFSKNGIENFDPKLIAIRDIDAWSRRADIVECRRIDAKDLSIPEKKKVLEYIMRYYRNGMLVVEDPNTYVLNMSHMEEIVGRLVNLRHKAIDVLISYQSMRAVEPRIWQNSRWVRMHYQTDSVDDIKNKLPNVELYKLAQLMVNQQFFSGNERFSLIIHCMGKHANKIEGKFTRDEFVEICKNYLRIKKSKVKEYMDAMGVSREEAINQQTDRLVKMYMFQAA